MTLIELPRCQYCDRPHGQCNCPQTPASMATQLAVDVQLVEARALHRVWRALNDGDCPKCHKLSKATDIEHEWEVEVENRPGLYRLDTHRGLRCPNCSFAIYAHEIREIEKLFAPAMDAALGVFLNWRKKQAEVHEDT